MGKESLDDSKIKILICCHKPSELPKDGIFFCRYTAEKRFLPLIWEFRVITKSTDSLAIISAIKMKPTANLPLCIGLGKISKKFIPILNTSD